MPVFSIVLNSFGGLGLFLFGMAKMSDGLKLIASDRIRKILHNLTKNRVVAILIGTAVTAIIQSSSATTVMIIGLVNAGLLGLQQAVALALGANIGTTCTAWIVSLIGNLQISVIALPAIGVGFFMKSFSKKKSFEESGIILLGLGLLFLGLDFMKEAIEPIRGSDAVVNFFDRFSTTPLLGLLAGAVVTAIIQSSSASIAIIQILAFNGAISFEASIPLMIGCNIGTTITAELAAIGTNMNSRRTAHANALFNILGACIILPFAWSGIYGTFIDYVTPGEITKTTVMFHIAAAHTVFNVINTVIFYFGLNTLIYAAKFLAKENKEQSEKTPIYLLDKFLNDPIVAMEQVIKELVRMAELARKTVQLAEKGFFENNEKLLNAVVTNEDALDDFQQAITQYLIRLSEKNVLARESREYPILIHSVNDLEKVGDYAKNIIRYAYAKSKNRLELPPEGIEEVQAMFKKLYDLFDVVIKSLEGRDSKLAYSAIDIEDQIDVMKAQCRENHINRMVQCKEDARAGTMIMDLAINIEKMGDHLISIAKAVIKDLKWGNKSIYPHRDIGLRTDHADGPSVVQK